MKIGYVKQSFKCLISEQLKLLNKENCMRIDTLPVNNQNYIKASISELSKEDEIVVAKLFVLANNIQELLEVLSVIESQKLQLKVLQPELSTSYQISFLHLLNSLDEFIQDTIKQKQLLGIVKAKAKGKHIGRPKKMNEKKILKAIELRDYYTNEQVAKMLKVSKSTLLRNIPKDKKAG